MQCGSKAAGQMIATSGRRFASHHSLAASVPNPRVVSSRSSFAAGHRLISFTGGKQAPRNGRHLAFLFGPPLDWPDVRLFVGLFAHCLPASATSLPFRRES